MLEWKPPLSPEWGEWKSTADGLLTEAENGAELGPDARRQLAECLHRMAGEKLGPMQQLQLERLARRAVRAVPQLEPFRFLRVGIVSDRTLDFLAPALQAAGLARLLLSRCWHRRAARHRWHSAQTSLSADRWTSCSTGTTPR